MHRTVYWLTRLLVALVITVGAFAGLPQITSIVNLASQDERFSPGVLARISRTGMGLAQPTTVPLSIRLNGFPGFLVSHNPVGATVQFPVEAQPGPGLIEVAHGNDVSPAFEVNLESHAPALFTSQGDIGLLRRLDGRVVNSANPAMPGEDLWIDATGLGPTNPPIETGRPAPSSPEAMTLTMPSMTIANIETDVHKAIASPGSIGRYRVFFRVPQALSAGQHPIVLTIAGFNSNAVILPLAGTGLPTISSIVSSGNYGFVGLASPGSILSLFGLNFGVDEDLSLFPATEFQALSVTFDGVKGPLFAVSTSRGQVNVYAPTELPEFGKVTVRLSTPNGTSESFDIQMAPTTPAFFRLTDPGGIVLQSAAAQLANTAWLVIPSSFAERLLIPKDCTENGRNPASICGQPAKAGDVIQVFATGLGKATVNGEPGGQILPTGETAPADGSALYHTIEVPEVTVDGIPAQVKFSGLAPGFAGLYQLNICIPEGVSAGDEIEIVIRTSNRLSDRATIAVMAE